MKNLINTDLYLETLGKTATLVLNLIQRKVTDMEFARENLKLARSVQKTIPNQMVIDMTKSWGDVMLNRINIDAYLLKWGITENQFWEVY